jgi:outer membrane lipoprotein-sorting protein
MRLEVTFHKVTVNGTVNPKAFSTEPPAGAETLSFDDAVEENADEETNEGE